MTQLTGGLHIRSVLNQKDNTNIDPISLPAYEAIAGYLMGKQ
ncbi:MAG: hypothetical protein ACI4AE_04520 [Candidatus Cryptobacteroides sp.]